MICENCLYNKNCRFLLKHRNGEAEGCTAFEDKSEWVHLPCKVGDIVYCFEPCFDTDHRPRLKVVEKEVVELKTIATVFGLNFDINNIGKTVFLTREEAEKALKDIRKDSNGGKTDD